jgi:hypothetical protein
MARPKNILETITLTIATNQPLVDQLESLVSSGLFGKSSTEAAERLIAKGVLDLQREGQLLASKGKKQKSSR